MKLDFKDLGHLILIGVIYIVVVVLMVYLVSPLLTTILPGVFSGPLTIVEILLFLILIRLAVR